MAYPEHPQEILIKNKFYPKGLKEIDTYNYYQQYKGLIMNETRGRDLMLAIMTEPNNPVIKRKHEGKFIQLTNSNYDKIIHPRVVAIYSTMKFYEEFFIIDVDVNRFELAKRATMDVYNSINVAPFVRGIKIQYTGKEGFHIVCKADKSKIDDLRSTIKTYLNQDENLRNYTIEQKRRQGVPNLDLSINKIRGAYITTHSLSIWGLKCMEVPFNQLKTFQPNTAKIKVK